MKVPDLNYFMPNDSNQVADRIHKTSIPGLFYVKHQQYDDHRGFYSELALVPDLNSVLETPFEIKQINQAHSGAKVARGLHAENWNKLVTINTGVAFCALVDVRPTSDTFKQVEYVILGQAENALNGSLFISAGIANSYCVLEAPVDYVYFVDQLYRERDANGDIAVSMFDEELNIQWPISKEEMVISERDKNAVSISKRFKL